MSGSFMSHQFTGASAGGEGVGSTYVLESTGLKAVESTGREQEFAMLRRGGISKYVGMRMPVEDLGITAEYMRGAFMETIGLRVMEVLPHELREGDSIDGLGAVGKVDIVAPAPRSDGSGVFAHVIAYLADTNTKIMFDSNEQGKFSQLIDITRAAKDDDEDA